MDKIIGLGKGLVDVLGRVESDEMLSKMELGKGSMRVIDEDKLVKMNEEFRGMKSDLGRGGCGGNGMGGMGEVGGGRGLMGKINNDCYGKFFGESVVKDGREGDLLV